MIDHKELKSLIEQADTQSLVFDWGTVQAQAKPKSSLHILVDYVDVQGNLTVGQIVRLGTLGQHLRYEIVGFQLDGESNQTQIWIELSPVEEPNLTQASDDSDDESSYQFMYAVDIPDCDPDNPWINVDSFDSEEEAIAFVKKHYGGDDEGRINLISEIDTP